MITYTSGVLGEGSGGVGGGVSGGWGDIGVGCSGAGGGLNIKDTEFILGKEVALNLCAPLVLLNLVHHHIAATAALVVGHSVWYPQV